MSKKLTEKSLEKKLHNMGTEELIQIIMSLYRSNKSVEQSINLQLQQVRMKNYINYGRTGWKVFYMILQASAGGWRSIYMRNIIRYHGYRRITDEQKNTQSAGCS